MTDLEQAAVDFFKAIQGTGAAILGHTEFVFKIDCTIGSRPEEAEHAKLISIHIQCALNVAKNSLQPLSIEGISLQ